MLNPDWLRDFFLRLWFTFTYTSILDLKTCWILVSRKELKMKNVMFLLVLWIHSSTAMIHTYQQFNTASVGVKNFPEYVVVTYVDGVEVQHYDSNTRRLVPKQDWMIQVTADDPQYWERNTNQFNNDQQVQKNNIEIVKQRFNQTGGVHIVQIMNSCEWDDETGEVKGYEQHGFDGEDFLVFDLQTLTWVAPSPQAVITKHKWDQNEGMKKHRKFLYTQECPNDLKKFVKFGSKTLMRTERPRVSLLQKTASSPVTCHATGFYPDRAMLFWTKDGEELHEDVEHGEILPNPDGTFQNMVHLKVPSDDWSRYECVFQLDGIPEDVVTKLERAKILSNARTFLTLYITIAAVAASALVLPVVGYFIYKKKKKGDSDSSSPPSSELDHLKDPSVDRD